MLMLHGLVQGGGPAGAVIPAAHNGLAAIVVIDNPFRDDGMLLAGHGRMLSSALPRASDTRANWAAVV
jgi:hypothetical protein